MPKSKETPAQRIKRLERELADEKLKNKLLNTTINISDKQYGTQIRKNYSPTTIKRIREQQRVSLSHYCQLFGISRQAVYQRQKLQEVRIDEKNRVVEFVLQERMLQPRLGNHKLYYLIKAKIKEEGIKMG